MIHARTYIIIIASSYENKSIDKSKGVVVRLRPFL